MLFIKPGVGEPHSGKIDGPLSLPGRHCKKGDVVVHPACRRTNV